MNTWHTNPLSPHERILVNEGLVVEYAPGHTLDSDKATSPLARAQAIYELLPSPAYTAITRTALWVYTGYIFPHTMPRLCASHPSCSNEYVSSRRTIRPSCTHTIAGLRLTTPVCTASDMLLLDEELAVDALRVLLHYELVTLDGIAEHLRIESRRKHSVHARHTFELLRTELAPFNAHASPLLSSNQ